MIFLSDNKTVMFDCDDTLVMWDAGLAPKPNTPGTIEFKDPCLKVLGLKSVWLTPHNKHIECLKNYKKVGYTVIVWSAGGSEWARCVVRTLGLEAEVDLVMTKPERYFDDVHADDFMTRMYFEPNTNKLIYG